MGIMTSTFSGYATQVAPKAGNRRHPAIRHARCSVRQQDSVEGSSVANALRCVPLFLRFLSGCCVPILFAHPHQVRI